MGKVKLQMKKLEEENNWRSTFAKRGNGVLKKACELSILCDTDVAIIAFSPTGELLDYCKVRCKSMYMYTRRRINYFVLGS
jgi:hypothetical protein